MNPNILDHSKYKLTVHVENIDTGQLYDVAPETESVTWQTARAISQPGKLEVILKRSVTSEAVNLPPGSRIRWGINGTDYFFGLIEEIELAKNGEGRVVYALRAVDHLALLKSVENMYRPQGTLACGFFTDIMTRFANRGLRGIVREPSAQGLDYYYFGGYTLYAMLKDTMGDAHIAEAPNRQYIIRDNLGTLEWRELSALRTPYVLGDASFTDSYTYGTAINNATYNVIKFVRNNDEIGMQDYWTKFDSDSIRRWWHRQLVVDAGRHKTDAEISNAIDLHLTAVNRPTRSLKLACIGINGVQAGDGVRIRADRGSIDHDMWIESATHVYTMDSHKMDLELYFVWRGEN